MKNIRISIIVINISVFIMFLVNIFVREFVVFVKMKINNDFINSFL